MSPRAFAVALWVGCAFASMLLGRLSEDTRERIATMTDAQRRTFVVLLVTMIVALGPLGLVLEVHQRIRAWRRRRYAAIVHEWDPELGWIRRELEPDDDDDDDAGEDG